MSIDVELGEVWRAPHNKALFLHEGGNKTSSRNCVFTKKSANA
jgi:hypothetical protein